MSECERRATLAFHCRSHTNTHSMLSHISFLLFFSYYALHLYYFFSAYYCHLISYLIDDTVSGLSSLWLFTINPKSKGSFYYLVCSFSRVGFFQHLFSLNYEIFCKIYLYLRGIKYDFFEFFSNIWWFFEGFIRKYAKSWLNLTLSDHWYNELKHYSLSTDVFD